MYSRLITIRTQKGITQKQMANLLGISNKEYIAKELQTKNDENVSNDFTIYEADKILKILNEKSENIFFTKDVNQTVDKEVRSNDKYSKK